MLTRIMMLLLIESGAASCGNHYDAQKQLPPAPPELLVYRNDDATPLDAGGQLSDDTAQLNQAIDSYFILHAGPQRRLQMALPQLLYALPSGEMMS